MEWLEFLKAQQTFFLVCVGVLGLLIGSFLNVLIWRLPKMLQREWASQCHTYLQDHGESIPGLTVFSQQEPLNLITPRSHCPHCKHPIGILENIPVLSFLFLRGKCLSCHQPISWRYPLIEILTAFFSIITAYYFGLSWQTLAALLLTWALLAMAIIDLDHQLLPDDITLPMLWLGLLLNIQSMFTSLTSAIIGVIAGYLFLWSVYWLFKLITHKEGMGYGDFKLLAMLGGWLGWQALPKIVLLSSLAGAIVGITLILVKRHKRSDPLPFGPFLALAGWVTLIWGDKLSTLYFSAVGLV